MTASIFLKLDGVEGDSVKKGHDGEIDIVSWSWDMSQTGLAHVGKGAGGGKVMVGDVTLTKRIDSATPSLMMKCCKGDHIPLATVKVERAGGDSPLSYMVLTMEKVFITNVSPSIASGDPEGMESLSLNFESFKIEIESQSESGAGGGKSQAGFNMATGEPA